MTHTAGPWRRDPARPGAILAGPDGKAVACYIGFLDAPWESEANGALLAGAHGLLAALKLMIRDHYHHGGIENDTIETALRAIREATTP